MWETIDYEKDGAVATIRINRPKAMNAMNFKMMEELPKALKDAEDDHDINVIVLGHHGPHFGAGYGPQGKLERHLQR